MSNARVDRQQVELLARAFVPHARRVVIKAGTRVLVQRSGRPDTRRLAALVKQIAALREAGREVILVSSGAIGAGIEALGWRERPTALADLQMAAAVGQSRLMASYDRLFAARRCQVGQVLLTHEDLKHRQRHLNARNTMLNLLRHRVVPIVNENDVVAVDEIKVGDNDQLAALVAVLVDAELLVLLTSADGLRAARGRTTRRVPYLPAVTPSALALAWGKGSTLSTGGMATKLTAAQSVLRHGALAAILDGRRPELLAALFQGADVGTLVGRAERTEALSQRKRWIAHFHRPQGALHIDEGAVRALVSGGKSLLPAGVRSVQGRFDVGALVAVRDDDDRLIAHGLVEYSSAQIEAIRGRRSAAIAALLGAAASGDEVIHRDNLVLERAP